MSLIQAALRLTQFHSPFLRTLIPSIGLAYGIQAAVAVPSVLLQSERFYDFSGSITYISCAALSLYLPTLRARGAAALAGKALPPWPSLLGGFTGNTVNAFNWRQVLLSAAVSIWATRLGTFLLSRISSEDGRDSRFDDIRGSPAKFVGAFFAQATWVTLCLLPILCVNSLPISTLSALGFGLTDILGILFWVGGMGFEATADRQKSLWMKEKKEKKHNEEFLTSGLWSKSRHPNYFGEITLWTGIAVMSAGVLTTSSGLAAMGLSASLLGKAAALGMAGVSPAFVTFLLTQVSGIPMSEKKYDARFKDNKKYQDWKKNTPVLIPKL